MFIIYTLCRPMRQPHYVGVLDAASTEHVDETNVTMQIYGTAQTETEAEGHRATLIERYGITSNVSGREPKKPCNRKKQPIPVKCVSSGITYQSAAAACRAHDIDRSAMSKHLNQPDKLPHVRGLIFKRIEP